MTYCLSMSSQPLAGFIDEVKINETHLSRQALREDLGNLDELMASIDKVGLLQPIIVRPVEGEFEVVAGNRRFTACKRLGWIKILCHIVELDDKEAFEISLIENVQRNMLNHIEEAQAFKKYVDGYGWGGVSDLARRIGKTQVYVSRRLRLLNLPKDVQNDIANNRLSSSVGEEILALNDQDKQVEIGARAAEEKLSRSEVRTLVKKIRDDELESDDLFVDSLPYSYSSLEQQQRITDRALARSIAALKISLYRIDDAINLLEEGWVVRQILFEHRKELHSHIDALMTLRKRFSKSQGRV